MNNKSDASFQHTLMRGKMFLEKDPDILLAYLFGSQAQGETGPLSDIDLAVLLKPASKRGFFEKKLTLLSELAAIFGRDDLDLVILNEAPLVLKYHILKDGKPLFIRDEELHINIIQKTISEYLDFKPILNSHYQALQRRIEDGQYANQP